jgi:putative FmdB family regulatory protein
MPLYEYECTSCHRRIEKIQKFSDPELTVCPYCAGKLERTITAAAVSFKGGGWFKDGYGSAKPAAPAGNDAAFPTPSDTGPSASPTSSESAAPPSTSDSAKPASTPSSAPAPITTTTTTSSKP